jgi:circadian clock protein KaiC
MLDAIIEVILIFPWALDSIKKRLSDFESKMQGFKITESGIRVGDPLTQLRGILTGNSEFISFNEKGSGSNEFKNILSYHHLLYN